MKRGRDRPLPAPNRRRCDCQRAAAPVSGKKRFDLPDPGFRKTAAENRETGHGIGRCERDQRRRAAAIGHAGRDKK